MKIRLFLASLSNLFLLTISSSALTAPVGDTPSQARAADGSYISWREHIIDDPSIAGFLLSGSDGLVMADIDKDGFEDIISVHEFDSSYDSANFEPDFMNIKGFPSLCFLKEIKCSVNYYF